MEHTACSFRRDARGTVKGEGTPAWPVRSAQSILAIPGVTDVAARSPSHPWVTLTWFQHLCQADDSMCFAEL